MLDVVGVILGCMLAFAVVFVFGADTIGLLKTGGEK